jgi:hypothetical protein
LVTLAGVVPDGVSAVRITYASAVTVPIAAGTNFWATVMPTLLPGLYAEPYRFRVARQRGRSTLTVHRHPRGHLLMRSRHAGAKSRRQLAVRG